MTVNGALAIRVTYNGIKKYNTVVAKSKGKRPRRCLEDNIKMDLKTVGLNVFI
jgi:hypothetical protein